MLRLVLCVFALASLAIGISGAKDIPPKATYLYYIQGELAGKSVMEITEVDDIFIFTSKSTLEFEDYSQDLTCRTEIEKATFRPRFFEYKGELQGQRISGTVWVEGDSIRADAEVDGNHFPSRAPLAEPTYLFQNYVAEHQIVITWGVDASDDPFLRFNILLPSDFMSLAAVSALDSEIELALSPRPAVCKKYAISMQNSAAYFTYYDPNRKIPVYLDFPATMTEVFLESAYGGKPVTKYEPPEESE